MKTRDAIRLATRPGSATAAAPVLALQDVSKTYTRGRIIVEALCGVTMTVEPNRLVAIVGPSGSGKSTLLNLLGALDVPTGGRLLFDGRDIAALSEKERTRFRAGNVGFIFQFFNLLPGLTSIQNVELAGAIAGMGAKGLRASARALLDLVGLEEQADMLARDLSGGQMQRVAVARALINDPRLILADEPTGNLDRHNAEEILKLLRERAVDGRAVIVVTHDQSLAVRYADEVISLLDGRVEAADRLAAADEVSDASVARRELGSREVEFKVGSGEGLTVRITCSPARDHGAPGMGRQ
ncbi:MAG: ABC transporter ATP-binding protein [Phycisphaeraceae bacterium]